MSVPHIKSFVSSKKVSLLKGIWALLNSIGRHGASLQTPATLMPSRELRTATRSLLIFGEESRFRYHKTAVCFFEGQPASLLKWR